MVKAMKKQSKFAHAAPAFRVRITTAAESPAKTPVFAPAVSSSADKQNAPLNRAARRKSIFRSAGKAPLDVLIAAPVSGYTGDGAVNSALFEDEVFNHL